MVANDVPKITDEQCTLINEIFVSTFEKVKENANEYFALVDDTYSDAFAYKNLYDVTKNNMVRSSTGEWVMSSFTFGLKNAVKIWKILGIEQHRPNMNGLIIFPNVTIPMHRDYNANSPRGQDDPIIYCYGLNGRDSMIYFSNREDGTKLVSMPAWKQGFSMHSMKMQHGASTGSEPLHLLQIKIDSI